MSNELLVIVIVVLVISLVISLVSNYRNKDRSPINVSPSETEKAILSDDFYHAVDTAIEIIDSYYEEHQNDQNDKTNYNVPALLRVLRAKYTPEEDAYYYKQLSFMLQDTLNNQKLAEDIVVAIN